MNKNENFPEWGKSENLRWAFWGWDPMPYYRRLGPMSETFFGNHLWMEQWWKRLYSPDTVKMMADLGINMVIPQFFKGAGLEFEKDLQEQLKALVQTCHEYGIKVMGYTQLGSLFYESILAEEPECAAWIVRTCKGEKAVYSYYRWRPCCNQPGFIDYMKKVIRIGYEEIGLDGFHFDNATPIPCYCERCKAGFKKYLTEKIKTPERMWITDFSHIEPPSPPVVGKWIADPLAQEWVRYNCEKGAANFGKLYHYVKSLNPALLVHANTGFPRYERWAAEFGINPWLFGRNTDLYCAENVNFPGYENGHLTTQIEAFRYGEAIGYQALPASWIHDAENGKITLPSAGAHAKLSIVEPLIHGGSPGLNYAMRTAGGSSLVVDNQEISRALREYLDFFDAHKPLFRSARTLAKVGIFHSFDSHAMGGHDVYMATSGMMLGLIAANIPFRYVMEEDMSELDDLTVIVLCHQMCLSDRTCDKIIDFVKRGGKLYLSGDSGNRDENLLLRRENAFASLAGNPNVIIRSDIPESCPEKDISDLKRFDWLQTDRQLPKQHQEVIAAIRRLLDLDDFIRVQAPASVVVTPRVLPDNTLVLHVLNYDHAHTVESVAVDVRLPLTGTVWRHLDPDRHEEREIGLSTVADGVSRLTFRDLETYQMAVIPLGDVK